MIVCRPILDMELSESGHTTPCETLARALDRIFNRHGREVYESSPALAETSKERYDLLIRSQIETPRGLARAIVVYKQT